MIKGRKLHDGVNLIGERFGRLVIISLQPRPNKKKSPKYLCKCDCGGETIVEYGSLTSGNTKSCGCLASEVARERSSLPFGASAFNIVFNRYKSDAKRRALSFNLNREEFLQLTQKNCYYCGQEPFALAMTKTSNGYFKYNGIDRKDSSMGYTIDNCVPCCKFCNVMKMDYPLEEFKQQIARIYNFFILENE